MQTDEIEQWLKPAEFDLYKKAVEIKAPTATVTFESLAECRRLMGKALPFMAIFGPENSIARKVHDKMAQAIDTGRK